MDLGLWQDSLAGQEHIGVHSGRERKHLGSPSPLQHTLSVTWGVSTSLHFLRVSPPPRSPTGWALTSNTGSQGNIPDSNYRRWWGAGPGAKSIFCVELEHLRVSNFYFLVQVAVPCHVFSIKYWGEKNRVLGSELPSTKHRWWKSCQVLQHPQQPPCLRTYNLQIRFPGIWGDRHSRMVVSPSSPEDHKT